MLTIIKPFQKTFAFSYTESLFWIRFCLFRVRVFKSQVRVLLNTSPDFFRVRVRVFLESGFSSSPGFEVCRIKLRLLVYISKQGQKHLLKGAVSNDSIRLG